MKNLKLNINKNLLILINWCIYITLLLITFIVDIVKIVKDFVPMFPGGTSTIIGVSIPLFILHFACIGLAVFALIKRPDKTNTCLTY